MGERLDLTSPQSTTTWWRDTETETLTALVEAR
jgi:hypothetical protein